MSRNTDQTKTLLEAWDVLTRYRWRFVLATFGVMTGVLFGSFLQCLGYVHDNAKYHP